MTDNPEYLTEQFRGWFIPLAVVFAYETRRLTAQEVMLLCLIDSLYDQKYGGCIIPPTDLALWWRRKKNHVLDAIEKFEKLGFVRIEMRGKLHVIKSLLQGDV